MHKTIKFFISIILIIGVLMTLVACGKSNTDTSSDRTDTESKATEISTVATTPTDDTTPATKPEATKPATTKPSISTTPTENTTTETETKPAETLALANPDTVLLDSNGVKLTALNFSEEASDSYVTIDVHIENSNTHSVNIMLNSLTVNGYLISGGLNSYITKAGADQVVPLNISKRDIEFAEIDEIREIVVSFYAKDDAFDMFILPTEPVSLKTTKFDTPAPELDTNGVQVYNDNDILIVAKEELLSDSRYMLAKLLIKNSTDSKISVSCTGLLVNGKTIANCNRIRYGDVPAGIISYNSLDIEKSDLEQLGIEEIETIEMTLQVLGSGYSLIADNLTVTVNYK